MKINAKNLISFLPLFCIGCDLTSIGGGYHNIGAHNSREEGQRQAITKILENYESLPTNRYYKVQYANRNAPNTEQRENAIWYNKTDSELIFEVDVSSGPVCRWKEVSRAILEQASKSTTSLATVDSLAKPNQPFRQCR